MASHDATNQVGWKQPKRVDEQQYEGRDERHKWGNKSTQALTLLRNLIRVESTPGREEAIVARIIQEIRSLGYDAWADAAGNVVRGVVSGSAVVLMDCRVDTIPSHGGGDWHRAPLGSVAAAVHGI